MSTQSTKQIKSAAAKFAKVKAELSMMEIKNDSKGYGYEYMSLNAFMPQVNQLMDTNKLLGVVSRERVPVLHEGKVIMYQDDLILTITNTEDTDDKFEIRHTVGEVIPTKDGTPNAQLRGSETTYARRYIWYMALDIAQTDEVDSQVGSPEHKEFLKEQAQVKKQRLACLQKLNEVIKQKGVDKDNFYTFLMEQQKVTDILEVPEQVIFDAIKNLEKREDAKA